MTRLARGWRTLALAGLALLAAAASPPACAAPTFPPLTGRVVDQAHVLPAPVVADLDAKLATLQAKTSRQLVVVTVPSLQGYDIADYGYQLGRAWGLGQKGLNNGALLIVAPTEHKVRIEVGYGLEGVVTDALSSVILQTRVLPKFKAGDMPGGVVAGADALIEQLSLDPSTAEQRLAAAATARSASSSDQAPSPIAVLFVVLFVVFMLRSMFRHGGGAGPWLAPIIFGGGGSRWGGGDGGGFGGGGGGFSGGGGSFGGGGSSGSW
ncbi:MAG TPA: TPM domain-containing protein [Caulobacteraceae bacterium]|jgi:uncharacterized protein|nr:TPM domain-containing protein [Caulobacteraceae bacterium]